MHSAAQHERGCFGRAAPGTRRGRSNGDGDGNSNGNSCIPWGGGVCPVAGDAVNPSLGAWPRHPCRGHPRNRTHPAFDSFRRSVGILVGVDLGRHVDPRHAWMLFDELPKYSISTNLIHARRGWMFLPISKSSIGFHPCMAWIHVSTKVDTYQQRKSVEGGVGPVAGVSAAWMPRPSPQGRVYGVPRNRTHPAIPQETSRCCCCCCCPGLKASAGAGRSPAGPPRLRM